MHLVIDDEPPIALVEDPEVAEAAVAIAPIGEHLISGDRDGAEIFAFTRVLAHVVGAEVGLVERLVAPLVNGRGARREDERCHR